MSTNSAVRVFDPARMDWAPFHHPMLPGGDLTPMVIVIDDYTMLAHFKPGFEAPEHSHPGGGTYYIIHGSMDFGDNTIVRAGMIRTVDDNHPYGPEKPDPTLGCTFLLVSRKPIHIDFATSTPPVTINGYPAGL